MIKYLKIKLNDKKLQVEVGSDFIATIKDIIREDCETSERFQVFLNNEKLAITEAPSKIEEGMKIDIVTVPFLKFKKDIDFPEGGLYGDDLLKAMELDEFYPSDSHFSDDVSMYGYSGIHERLIAHCQQYAGYASDDKKSEEFEYYKQVALAMKEAIRNINKIPIPESLEGSQPYGDGKL